MKIGIGISTTPNRDILLKTLPEWERFLPKNARIVIENDVDYSGVSKTKNRLLANLEDCEHIFLVDDDVKPLIRDWYKPYINSGHKHLMYQFKLPGKPDTDMQVTYNDDQIIAYTHTRGAFVYFHKSVLNEVGGFDESYTFGYEHPDLTNRIHNAGLTEHRAADVIGSEKLLYCYDQDGAIKSSMTRGVRERLRARDHKLYLKSKTSAAYKEFK